VLPKFLETTLAPLKNSLVSLFSNKQNQLPVTMTMTAKSPGNFNFSPYLFETTVKYNEELRNENEKMKNYYVF
jgi:hypothetical protein